jgi:predicted small metal-binding protein
MLQTGGRSVRRTSKGVVMAKVIRCQCGFLGRGETAQEAAAVIEVHMRSDHPELVGKVTRDDLMAMAEES